MKVISPTLSLYTLACLSLFVLVASDARSPKSIEDNNQIDSDIHADLDNRIVVPETVKSVAKISAGIAIEKIHASVPGIKYLIKLDTATSYINRLAYELTKKKFLWTAIKFIAATVSAVSAMLFFFPGTYNYLESRLRAYEDYVIESSRYLANSNFEPDAIVEQLTRSSDIAMDKWGLSDRSCRERSICEIGDILACQFPAVVATIKKFAADNLPEIDTERNKYTRAFMKGLNHNCSDAYSSISVYCPSLQDWLGAYVWGNTPKKPNM